MSHKPLSDYLTHLSRLGYLNSRSDKWDEGWSHLYHNCIIRLFRAVYYRCNCSILIHCRIMRRVGFEIVEGGNPTIRIFYDDQHEVGMLPGDVEEIAERIVLVHSLVEM